VRLSKHDQAGYSLIELVIFVVILSIACYFIFIGHDVFSEENPMEQENLAAEIVQIAIHNYGVESQSHGRNPMFPLSLDEAKAGTAATDDSPLFTLVLNQGLRSNWTKIGPNQYVYGSVGADTVPPHRVYYYAPLTGAFIKGQRPGGTVTASLKPLAVTQRLS
jgi:type II secretory pathway pseudopilin PulG